MDTAVLVSTLTAVAALAAAVGAYYNARKIHQIHLDVNGRIDALLRATMRSSHAEGVVEGEANRDKAVAEASERSFRHGREQQNGEKPE